MPGSQSLFFMSIDESITGKKVSIKKIIFEY